MASKTDGTIYRLSEQYRKLQVHDREIKLPQEPEKEKKVWVVWPYLYGALFTYGLVFVGFSLVKLDNMAYETGYRDEQVIRMQLRQDLANERLQEILIQLREQQIRQAYERGAAIK